MGVIKVCMRGLVTLLTGKTGLFTSVRGNYLKLSRVYFEILLIGFALFECKSLLLTISSRWEFLLNNCKGDDLLGHLRFVDHIYSQKKKNLQIIWDLSEDKRNLWFGEWNITASFSESIEIGG